MASYTTQVRSICENYAGLMESVGFGSVNEVIQLAIPKIFDFEFPIFDENYRNVLCTKILKRFYTREIGVETVGLWKLKLDTKLNEIMPYYNQLYKSELLEFNPLYDVDVTKTHQGNEDRTTSENRTGTETMTETTEESGSRIGTGNETINREENRVVDTTGIETRSSEDNGEITTNSTRKLDSIRGQDETRKEKRVRGEDGTINTSGSENRSDLYSDTPQSSVDNMDNGYLTNVRKISDTNTSNQTNAVSVTDDLDVTNALSGTDDITETNNVNGTSKDTSTGSVKTTGKNTESGDSKDTHTRSTNESDSRTEETQRTGNTSGNLTGAYKTLDEYTSIVRGKQGTTSYSSMLQQFRETFLNIDIQILNELEVLFMQIW